jgi:hypothetical protein
LSGSAFLLGAASNCFLGLVGLPYGGLFGLSLGRGFLSSEYAISMYLFEFYNELEGNILVFIHF